MRGEANEIAAFYTRAMATVRQRVDEAMGNHLDLHGCDALTFGDHDPTAEVHEGEIVQLVRVECDDEYGFVLVAYPVIDPDDQHVLDTERELRLAPFELSVGDLITMLEHLERAYDAIQE